MWLGTLRTVARQDGGRASGRVSGRVDVLRTRCGRDLATVPLDVLEECEALFDQHVCWVEISRSGIGIDRVGNLIVAALVQRTQVEPYFGDVRVDADGTRVSVESITELIDVVV